MIERNAGRPLGDDYVLQVPMNIYGLFIPAGTKGGIRRNGNLKKDFGVGPGTRKHESILSKAGSRTPNTSPPYLRETTIKLKTMENKRERGYYRCRMWPYAAGGIWVIHYWDGKVFWDVNCIDLWDFDQSGKEESEFDQVEPTPIDPNPPGKYLATKPAPEQPSADKEAEAADDEKLRILIDVFGLQSDVSRTKVEECMDRWYTYKLDQAKRSVGNYAHSAPTTAAQNLTSEQPGIRTIDTRKP